jgi:hypothetical protein
MRRKTTTNFSWLPILYPQDQYRVLSESILPYFREDKVDEYERLSWHELMEHPLINANLEKAFELRYNTIKKTDAFVLEFSIQCFDLAYSNEAWSSMQYQQNHGSEPSLRIPVGRLKCWKLQYYVMDGTGGIEWEGRG